MVLACTPALVRAQELKPWPNAISYGTALVNPVMAVVDAWKSNDRPCKFGRLALSELVGNGTTLVMKHFIVSPRPYIGSKPDGMPSGHTMNSSIGMFSSKWGFVFAVATGVERHEANAHTWKQIGMGAAIGVGSELTGHLIRCKG